MDEITPNTIADGRPSHEHSLKRSLRNCVGFISIGYIGWCGFLWLFQDQLLFPRNLAPRPPAVTPYRNAETFTRKLDDGTTVHAIFIPAPQASAEHPAPAVIYFHGNAEIVEYQDNVVDLYRSMGVSVLLPEYRGYGRTGGKPSQRAIREDAMRFIEMMMARKDVDTSRVFLHGRSLGGGVACDIARTFTPKAMILESTFLSVARQSWRYGVPPLLVRNPFRNDEALASYTGPLLIFHGTHDEILSVEEGRELHKRMPGSRYVEYDSMHNDFPGRGNEADYTRQVREFLVEHGLIGATPSNGP